MKKSQLYAISYNYSRKSKEKAIEELKEERIYTIFLIQKYFKNGYKSEKGFLNGYKSRTNRFNKVFKKSYVFLKKCAHEKEEKNVDISLNKYDIKSYQDLKAILYYYNTLFKL